MCIIAIKDRNTANISDDILENMFRSNPDGAGLMYPDGHGNVQIRKGFMTFNDFMTAVSDLDKVVNIDKTPIIYHFRIATSGGTSGGNTHPFPLAPKLPMLQREVCKARVGIAHNGIISLPDRLPVGASDTAHWITHHLYPLALGCPDWYKNVNVMQHVERQISSKLAVMDGNGYIATLGYFNSTASQKGWRFSNYSHEYAYKIYGSYAGFDWDDVRRECGATSRADWVLARPIDIDLEYLIDSKGEYVDSNWDFYLADDGGVYQLDYQTDFMRRRADIRAYDSRGCSLQWFDSLDRPEADWYELAPLGKALTVVNGKGKSTKGGGKGI